MNRYLAILLTILFSLQTFAGINYSEAVKNKNFLIEVQKGNIPGHSITTFFGHNPVVGTATETIMPCGGLLTFPAAATQIKLSSDNTTNNQAGVAARAVLLVGLDLNHNPLSEVLPLHATDGLLEVLSVNEYLRLNTMIVVTAGSSGKNADIIYAGTGVVTAGVPATVFRCMGDGGNLDETAAHTLRAGVTGYPIQATYNGEANKALVLEAYLKNVGSLFLRIAAFNLSSNSMVLTQLTPPSAASEKSDLEFRGFINTGTGDIKVAFSYLIVEN